MKKSVNTREQLPMITISGPCRLSGFRNLKSEIVFTISFVTIITLLALRFPTSSKSHPYERFLKAGYESSEHNSVMGLTSKEPEAQAGIQSEPRAAKKRKLTLKSYYNSYPSFSYPYQQYYGAYNYIGNTNYGGPSYQFPYGGMPFYQRPAVPYGGQMTSPIFNYGYQHLSNLNFPNGGNLPSEIQVPQIITMPSVGSALGYGRTTFIQQPEIGGSGTQSGTRGPGPTQGQNGPGLQSIIDSLMSEGGLLDPAFLGSLARLFLDGNLESLAVSALDIITRIGEGEDTESLIGDLTEMIFNGFLNGVIPGLGDSNTDSGTDSNSGVVGEFLNLIGNLDLGELGNIELPLSPPSIISPNILDAVLERFGLEAELGAPEVVEREALARSRFKSEMTPISITAEGKKIALVTLDDILKHFSPLEKLTVAKLRTVLFVKYQISNPETANEYIQFILKNEIPVIGAHIPGAPVHPTPLEFYQFAGNKKGELTFKDIMKILELFYDIHDPTVAESIALALERLGIDIVGYNLGSSRERAANIANTINQNKQFNYDFHNDKTTAPDNILLKTPKKSNSRMAYGPANPNKQQFLSLFPHTDNITTNDLREVLKFYYGVFDEETVRFVRQHMQQKWNINVN